MDLECMAEDRELFWIDRFDFRVCSYACGLIVGFLIACECGCGRGSTRI